MRRNAKSSCDLRHNSSQGRIGNAVYVFFMRLPAFLARWSTPVHSGPHGAIDGGSRGDVCAFTMNSVAREPFHIYMPLS
jgi:hypothetical protein